MAAKRKIDLFIEILNEKEFENVLKNNADRLICAEIYCTFAGSCTALDRLFNTIKLDWSDGKIVLLKVPADEIKALKRFRNQSEPVFMFILNQKVIKVFRGVDSLKFAEVAKREMNIFKEVAKGVEFSRPTYQIDEATPDETASILGFLIPQISYLSDIIMVGREEIELTEETARDVLYAGDAPLNEASLLKLVSDPALAICFRLLDTDKHFVSLVRKILYQDLPVYDDNKPHDAQAPLMTAFDLYKSFSPTRAEVMENRQNEKIRLREEVLEKRARRLSEMQRLARQEIEDAMEAQTMNREHRRLELLKSGVSYFDELNDKVGKGPVEARENLQALKEFDQEPDEEINIDVPEDLPDEYMEEDYFEDPDEYFPPPGLLIPGFYAPPNDVAKANGLAILFPKLVAEYVTPEPEFLPPHVLVMLEISKRYKAVEAMMLYKKAIIHMGVFKAKSPFDGQLLAYSVKQYDTLDTNSMNQFHRQYSSLVDTIRGVRALETCNYRFHKPISGISLSQNRGDIKLVFMLSVENDLPLLQLMDLSPVHVSRDTDRGGDECAAMFSVEYADNYPEFEDFVTDGN